MSCIQYYTDDKKKVCTIKLNVQNVLLTMLRNTMFHAVINDFVSYILQFSIQEIDPLLSVKFNAKMHVLHV